MSRKKSNRQKAIEFVNSLGIVTLKGIGVTKVRGNKERIRNYLFFAISSFPGSSYASANKIMFGIPNSEGKYSLSVFTFDNEYSTVHFETEDEIRE